ncbi:MAG TPA: sugar phosphate isomerase/epimerase family protein, partial [Verrucomicrobiales bacterium]|nr:sugar phosphate isomerase/epimerase family protein [Verrucomicrobiales bacterium]
MSVPRLSAFPKAYMSQLCRDGSLSLREWIAMAAELDVDGLEWYCGFLEMQDRSQWTPLRRAVEEQGMCIPMLCCSPDFTHPDPAFREEQIVREKGWIDMAAELGAGFCRVLSGQRRPELEREEGIRLAAEGITACLPHARARGVTLILENHYKDDFWQYPEFVQDMESFCALVDRIHDSHFGVNYDPSNAILAGDDPLTLLDRVAARVLTMHASDRYLAEGSLEDLRREESGVEGYARRLRHGEIGQGLNDYDAIFNRLRQAGFHGWISIEDGVDGMEQLRRSVEFLR